MYIRLSLRERERFICIFLCRLFRNLSKIRKHLNRNSLTTDGTFKTKWPGYGLKYPGMMPSIFTKAPRPLATKLSWSINDPLMYFALLFLLCMVIFIFTKHASGVHGQKPHLTTTQRSNSRVSNLMRFRCWILLGAFRKGDIWLLILKLSNPRNQLQIINHSDSMSSSSPSLCVCMSGPRSCFGFDCVSNDIIYCSGKSPRAIHTIFTLSFE